MFRPLRRREAGYAVVLLLIGITYIVCIGASSGRVKSVVLVFQIFTVLVVLQVSDARRTVRYVAYATLAVATVIAILSFSLPGNPDSILVRATALFSVALYFVAPWSILRHLLERPTVDRESLLGAIAAYLLLGMFFAFLFAFAGLVRGGGFFGPNTPDTLSNDLFFSFTTATTTGYGNLIPAGNPGQTFAVLEMVTGQLFLVIAVARVVTSFIPTALKNRGSDGSAESNGDTISEPTPNDTISSTTETTSSD